MPDELGYWEIAGRLALAVLVGSALGLERRAKPAGLRTHGLVSLGAALFMVASLELGEQAVRAGATTYDPSRIASTVVQGVGFIAAGVIFGGGSRIRGLTTAASLWVAAALGLLAGAGLWQVALMGTAAALVVLVAFRLPERFVLGPGGKASPRRRSGPPTRASRGDAHSGPQTPADPEGD